MFVFKHGFSVLLAVFLSLVVVSSGWTNKSIIYDEISTFNNYKSVVEFVDETLEPIYELSKDFIDSTVPVNFNVGLFEKDWKWDDVMDHYAGIAAYVIIMLVIGLLIPVIGIIFCASRCCCGCCGGKPTERHPTQGKASIIIAGGFTIIFTAFIVFAIAVGMRSNVVMEKGAENIFDKMIVTMQDTIKYADNTYTQLDELMTRDYNTFANGLYNELDAIGERVVAVIDTGSLDQIKIGFATLKDSIPNLESTQTIATLINSGLDDMILQSKVIANGCVSNTNPSIAAKCNEIKTVTDMWNYPPINDFTPEIDGMKAIDFDSLNSLIEHFKLFGSTLKDSLSGISAVAKDNTDAAGLEIQTNLAKSNEHIVGVKDWMKDRIYEIRDTQGYYNDWGKLRYGLTFLLPIILIFMLIFVILGFLVGTCCRSAYYKEKGCGNASVASDFFMINVSLIFIFTVVFAVVICVYYAFGMLGQRYICNTFHTMDNIEGLKYLDDNLDIQQYFGQDVTLEHLLKTCHDNQPVYEVLILKNDFHLEDIIQYIDTYNIRESVNQLTKEIERHVDIFNQSFPEDPLKELITLRLDEVVITFSEVPTLKQLRSHLIELSDLDPSIANIANVIILYDQYISSFNNLKDVYEQFKRDIKMGGTLSYNDAILQFDGYIRVYHISITSGVITQLGSNLADASILTVEEYLHRIKDKMLDTIGLCQPASTAVKATLNEACGNVFNPMNAFWVANFFALIAFIPLLILFIHLVSYFRQYVKTDEERYRRDDQFFSYNPPGTRGSAIQAYDVRAHHQTQSPPTYSNSVPNTNPHNQMPSITTTPLPPIPPNQYYNPNSGSLAARPRVPIYPPLAGSEQNTLTSAAGLMEQDKQQKNGSETTLGAQGRNLRRQQEYPYAMKGANIPDSDASRTGRDNYTKF